MTSDQQENLKHNATNRPTEHSEDQKNAWFNYLVCRTGGAASNTRIASLAKARGYQWNPYSAGFTDLNDARVFPMGSEEEVFRFVGLAYEEPEERA